ncbi:MAG: hypothetical protein DMF52_14120 [Acidobacteria bacterium]|nr:MAG: hypothetical protein DMF52_14120 [Acidobacteriota bacterium]
MTWRASVPIDVVPIDPGPRIVMRPSFPRIPIRLALPSRSICIPPTKNTSQNRIGEDRLATSRIASCASRYSMTSCERLARSSVQAEGDSSCPRSMRRPCLILKLGAWSRWARSAAARRSSALRPKATTSPSRSSRATTQVRSRATSRGGVVGPLAGATRFSLMPGTS